MSDEPERYSEDEVALILRRAAEIQAGRSMTLAELEAAATEAGIDGALVRRAAVEVRTRPHHDQLEVHGVFGQTRLAYERAVSGPIGPDRWEELVAEIRRQLGVPGSVQSIGKELVWTMRVPGEASGRDVRVTVFGRRTHTVIRVEENVGGLAGGLYGGIMGGTFPVGIGWVVPVCVAALGFPQLIPILLGGWIVLMWYLARVIQRAVLQNRHEQLNALADGLEEAARDQ